MGTAQIAMPENYIAMFSAPQADEARKIVAKAEPSIDRAIAAIQANQPFAPTRNKLYDRFMSGPVNPIFYKFFVKANAFTASSACIGCGQCAKRCPMNNVTLKDGKTHSVDSSDFAFRTAGKNAVREALKEAGTTVLQPIMRIEVHVPSIYTGEVVQIVSGLKGQVQGFESHPTASGWDVFHALLANSAVENLAHSLGSGTRGTAWFTSELDHYDPMK